MLLDGDNIEDKKDKNKKNIQGFNLNNYNLDIDFPELK